MTKDEIKRLRKGARVVQYNSGPQQSGKVTAKTGKFLVVKWDDAPTASMILFEDCTNITRVTK